MNCSRAVQLILLAGMLIVLLHHGRKLHYRHCTLKCIHDNDELHSIAW